MSKVFNFGKGRRKGMCRGNGIKWRMGNGMG